MAAGSLPTGLWRSRSLKIPQVTVEADAIQVHDGNLRTAAGVTAGLDLALTLVQEDLGDEIAKDVAGHLVMYFKRTGGQMQFSRQGSTSPTGRSALQALQRYVAANPALDHGVANLAERMGVSPRHFARIFQNDVGMTPAAWVEQTRVNAARERLEAGNDAPKQVAAMCGFANADTLRRAFVRHMGVTLRSTANAMRDLIENRRRFIKVQRQVLLKEYCRGILRCARNCLAGKQRPAEYGNLCSGIMACSAAAILSGLYPPSAERCGPTQTGFHTPLHLQ